MANKKKDSEIITIKINKKAIIKLLICFAGILLIVGGVFLAKKIINTYRNRNGNIQISDNRKSIFDSVITSMDKVGEDKELYVKIINESINVRKNDYVEENNLIGKVLKDDIYKVLDIKVGETNYWYLIVDKNNQSGYIASGSDELYIETITYDKNDIQELSIISDYNDNSSDKKVNNKNMHNQKDNNTNTNNNNINSNNNINNSNNNTQQKPEKSTVKLPPVGSKSNYYTIEYSVDTDGQSRASGDRLEATNQLLDFKLLDTIENVSYDYYSVTFKYKIRGKLIYSWQNFDIQGMIFLKWTLPSGKVEYQRIDDNVHLPLRVGAEWEDYNSPSSMFFTERGNYKVELVDYSEYTGKFCKK